MSIKLFFDRHVSGTFSGSFAGSIESATSASFATTASFAQTGSYVAAADIDGAVGSASFATTASFAQTGSYVAGGDVDGAVASATSASYADKAAVAPLQLSLNNNFGADIVITDLTGSIEEWDEGQRTKVDFTNYTSARVIARVNDAEISGAVGVQYSTDESAWSFLDGGEGPSASLATIGTIASSFVDLEGAAQDDVFVRWVTFSGSEASGDSGSTKIGSVVLFAR